MEQMHEAITTSLLRFLSNRGWGILCDIAYRQDFCQATGGTSFVTLSISLTSLLVGVLDGRCFHNITELWCGLREGFTLTAAGARYPDLVGSTRLRDAKAHGQVANVFIAH